MEVMMLCVTIGILMCASMFCMGIAIGREAGKHERVDKGDSERSDKCEHADRADYIVANMGVDRDSVHVDQGQIPVRGNDRQNLRQVRETKTPRYIKELTGEQLANAVRMMCLTGICPSEGEKDLLYEVAERLDKEEL